MFDNFKSAGSRDSFCILRMWAVLVVNIVLSITGYCVILNVVPKLKDMFVKAHLSGVDLNKKNKPEMYFFIVKFYDLDCI